jgi:hypothetical protein
VDSQTELARDIVDSLLIWGLVLLLVTIPLAFARGPLLDLLETLSRTFDSAVQMVADTWLAQLIAWLKGSVQRVKVALSSAADAVEEIVAPFFDLMATLPPALANLSRNTQAKASGIAPFRHLLGALVLLALIGFLIYADLTLTFAAVSALFVHAGLDAPTTASFLQHIDIPILIAFLVNALTAFLIFIDIERSHFAEWPKKAWFGDVSFLNFVFSLVLLLGFGFARLAELVPGDRFDDGMFTISAVCLTLSLVSVAITVALAATPSFLAFWALLWGVLFAVVFVLRFLAVIANVVLATVRKLIRPLFRLLGTVWELAAAFLGLAVHALHALLAVVVWLLKLALMVVGKVLEIVTAPWYVLTGSVRGWSGRYAVPQSGAPGSEHRAGPTPGGPLAPMDGAAAPLPDSHVGLADGEAEPVGARPPVP